MTWNDYLPKYREHLKEKFARHTADAYYRDISDFIRFAPDIEPSNVKEEDISDFMDFLEEENRLSSSTRIRCLSGIKYFYKYLISLGEIETSPIFNVKAPELEMALPVILEPEDVEKLIRACDLTHKNGYRDVAIINMLYCAGLTVSELCHLKVRDVDFEKEQIDVNDTPMNTRIIPMIHRLRDSLLLYLSFGRDIIRSNNDLLFDSTQGSGLFITTVFFIIKRIARKANLEKANARALRYSCQYHLAQGGADIRVIKYVCGSRLPSLNPGYLPPSVKFIREAFNLYHPFAK